MMSEVDETIKYVYRLIDYNNHLISNIHFPFRKNLEPCKYFEYTSGAPVWLNRAGLRALETELKKK